MELEILRQAFRRIFVPNFVKISSVGAELFHADGRTDRRDTDRRTDMTKLMAAFRNFIKAPKNCYIISVIIIVVLLKYFV